MLEQQARYAKEEAMRGQHLPISKLGFPMGRDSAIFWDKGSEVPSLSRDKGTTGQAQNLATGWDETEQEFDSLSRPVPGRPAGQK